MAPAQIESVAHLVPKGEWRAEEEEDKVEDCMEFCDEYHEMSYITLTAQSDGLHVPFLGRAHRIR